MARSELMSRCGNCGQGCCGSCGSCGEWILSPGEISMLQKLLQIPFLPVARLSDCADPVYLEDDVYSREEYSLILQCLEKRGLISLDYGTPLKGSDVSVYRDYPILGSFGFTAKGQAIAESLELQGVFQES